MNSIREKIGRVSEENEVKNKPALPKTSKLPKSKSPKLNFFTPKLRCTFCEKTFRNKAVMRIHMKKHGVTENIDPNRFKKASIEEIKQKIRDLQCKKCNYKFLKKESFDKHMKKCYEEETLNSSSELERKEFERNLHKHECIVCLQRFSTKGNLDTHFLLKHKEHQNKSNDISNGPSTSNQPMDSSQNPKSTEVIKEQEKKLLKAYYILQVFVVSKFKYGMAKK